MERDIEWEDRRFVGLPAIARRMNLNVETIKKMHYNASSPALSFPMFRIPFKNWGSWTTSNFLIYEWELRMTKFSYEELRKELGLETYGRQDAFEKLQSRWDIKRFPKEYRIERVLAKITNEKPVYPGRPVRD